VVAKRKHSRSEHDAATPTLAERHTFAAGILGHDFSSSQWVVNVSENTALSIDAVYACVRIISDAVAGSSVGEWEGSRQLDTSRFIARPDPDVSMREWLWQFTACAALYNAVWVQAAMVGDDVLAIRPVAPSRVNIIGDTLYVDAKEVQRKTMRLFRRAVWPTVSASFGGVLDLAREAFAASMAADAYASDFWQQGGAPVTVLKTDQPVDDTIATAISDRWSTMRTTSPGKAAVLGRGVTPMAFGADLGTDGANMAQDKLRASAARYFGVPADLINVASEAGSLTYSTTEQHGLHLVRYTVSPYCDMAGDALSSYLPGDNISGRRVILDPRRLTMAEQESRFRAWQIATGKPFMTTAEVRAAENLPPDDELAAAPSTAQPFGVTNA
jgi:HK97 family phage portal protein